MSGEVPSSVFHGASGRVFTDQAVAMHMELPRNKAVELGIVNIFAQGGGDTIKFPEDGFVVTDTIVNGEKRNFAEYLTSKQIDTRIPLVADYYGVAVNVSIQAVDTAAGKVARARLI